MVPVDHPLYPTFLNKYVRFDEGEHDDMLDADDIVRRLILQNLSTVILQQSTARPLIQK